jgi:hypothetical protein
VLIIILQLVVKQNIATYFEVREEEEEEDDDDDDDLTAV